MTYLMRVVCGALVVQGAFVPSLAAQQASALADISPAPAPLAERDARTPQDVAVSSKATVQSGPTLESARAGMTVAEQPRTERTMAAAAQRENVQVGQNVALMAVGGVALLTGLIIGGDSGTLIAVGGVVVGLYGLYNYLK